MESTIKVVIWNSFLVNAVASNISPDHPQEVDLAQYLQRAYEALDTDQEKIEEEGFFQLPKNVASDWLFLRHTTDDADLQKLLGLFTIPQPHLYLTKQVPQNEQSFFERLLTMEATVEFLGSTRSLNQSRLQGYLQEATKLLQMYDSITHHKVDMLEFAQHIPNSVVIPLMTELTARGANGKGQANNEALARFTGLKKVSLDLFDYAVAPLPSALFELSGLQELRLPHNGLSELPPGLAQLKKLRLLHLGANRLKKLPEVIGKLSHLENLYLNDNQIDDLPPWFVQLSKLIFLSLSHNAFTEFPEITLAQKELLVVYLDNNQITQIPARIADSNTNYYLQDNLLDKLPPELEVALRNHKIKIAGNPLRKLSSAWIPFLRLYLVIFLSNSSETGLTSLFCWMHFHEQKEIRKMARDKLQELLAPELFEEMKGDWRYRKNPDSEKVLKFCLKYYHRFSLHWSLLKVWLEGLMKKPLASIYSFQTPFYALPEDLFTLSALQKLDTLILYDALLDTMPTSITQLAHLKYVSIGNSHNEAIFDLLPQLKLRTLSLVNNHLQMIPEVIGQMHTLKQLSIRKYIIKGGIELLTQLPKLEVLDLRENHLTHVPETIIEIPYLKELDLSQNRLGEDDLEQGYTLPLRIGFMDHLVKLDLSYNQLTKIPPGIGLLEKLEEIRLDSNQFQELPIEVCEIETLEVIYINNNHLTCLPKDIQELTRLKQIHLRDNPISSQERIRITQLLPNTKVFF